MMGSGGDNRFIYSAVVFAVAVLFLTPVMVNFFVHEDEQTVENPTLSGLLDDYYNFTGAQSNIARENVWVLSGIYTPYLGGPYSYEPNGWLYGARIGGGEDNYLPSQYDDTVMDNCTVHYDEDSHCYRYTQTTFDGHSAGDVYSAVTMDVAQQSDIFFTTSGKQTRGGYFWYEFSGYRYEFTPASLYTMYNENGDIINVDQSNSGLSLIWYNYLDQASGISGQLILSTDYGVAFLTTEDILRAYESSISTAKFEMVFNGVPINIYIRLNPYYISQGVSVDDCWNAGYWEVMVSTNSVDVAKYISADYSFNIYQIWDTFVNLFTFNTDVYGFDGLTGTMLSLLMCVPMYALLISIGLTCYPVLIIAGIVAAVQALATAIANWDWGDWFDGIDWPWE